MKKLFALVFLAFWVSLGFAQDGDSLTIERNNVVKFLPVNLLFQSIAFEYERMINPSNYITLGIGIPNQKSMIGKYGIDFGSDVKSAELGTMHIRAAYRHYTSQRMLPKGFYIEPYVKYLKISGNGNVENADFNDTYKGHIDVNLNSMNLGFQLGTQFLIAKRITLDLYFLGLEAGILNGDINATSDLGDPYATHLKTYIENKIADLPSYVGDKLTVSQSADKKRINVNANNIIYPWYRGGFSIGIAF